LTGGVCPLGWLGGVRSFERGLGFRLVSRRFIMNAGRTTKQGQQINVGKDGDEYKAIVGTITMHPDDMRASGIVAGATVRVWSDEGEATFLCKEGKVPTGMIFVPYGPPTCRLMGQTTDGTGMPTSKGWEVQVEMIADGSGTEQPS
jgi:formylmethanofuran dehydrogenase subunit D